MAKNSVTETETESVARISLPLKPDGTIDSERMRPATRNKIETDPWVKSLAPAMKHSGGNELVPAVAMGVIFDLLGSIEMLIACKITNCTPQQAEIFRYTIAEKEALQPPTARLVQKYLGANMSAYADEIAVAGLLTTTFLAKLQAFQPRGELASFPALVKSENAEKDDK